MLVNSFKGVKIRKKFDRWNRLSNDERKLKLSELYDKPIDDNMITYLSELYEKYLLHFYHDFESYDKLIKGIETNNNNYTFNILIETYPLIIPVIDRISSIDNIEISMSSLHTVYDKDNDIFRKVSGIIYISGILIPKGDKYISDVNFIKSYAYVYIMNHQTFIRDIYEILKCEIIYKNITSAINDTLPVVKIVKHYESLPVVDINTYYANRSDISSYNILNDIKVDNTADEDAKGFEHKEISFEQNKEYEVDPFSSTNVIVDDRTHLHNIIVVLNSNIFYNVKDIDNMYEINKLISIVDVIKLQLNQYIVGLDDETYSILYNVFAPLALLIVLLIKVLTLNEYRINTYSNVYMKFKNNSQVKSINKYGYVKQYLIYIFSTLFDEDFKIMIDNKIKIDKIIDSVYKEYKRNAESISHDVKQIITENKIIAPIRGEVSIKLLKMLSGGKYSLYDIASTSTQPYVHISDRNVKYKYYVEKYVDKKVYYDQLYTGPASKLDKRYNLIKHGKIIFSTMMDTNNSKTHIYNILNKLKTKIHDKDITKQSKKIDNIGYLIKRQTEDKLNIIDTTEYKMYMLEVMKKEWNMIHGVMDKYDNNIDIYEILDDYIKDTETAEDVYDFINHYINMTKYFDISLTSIDNKRIMDQELREERINVYYNLTPEEKLEIDKFDFGSDEWNTEISLRAELYTGKKLVPITDIEVDDSDSWNENNDDIDG
jgi:hypothetical protein